ncbi:DNA polymerase III subunit alpha [Candidatus Uhrbacteria bacterium CG10_big_fil_rev_8_21_14_0_10_50_16]|uniref:DNA polymerase III subunit alpha n=1 Tax=Candidatus Uhrbacteria bacterium CG10_big_fil_rev_8_21_14_0_10_50_16 TaxID=1975039 RepID=A0A2H0RLK5_9BACT|nr:MAG: DNA polymerase III subunit alpha [Candidatus Uhrbacteria bacterium CG10_big_fil_rev_8_21_14_0_10_50_16]
MQPSDFVHLHTHSYYSLLGALPGPDALVKRIKAQGGNALAITDNDALYGAVDFYQNAQANDVQPIIGVDVHVAPNGRHQKRARVDKHSWRFVLLAETLEGYEHLLKLTSQSYLEGFYYTPRVDDELLQEMHGGLIGLSGGMGGEIPTLLKQGDRDKAYAAAKRYADLFGPDGFYIEVVYRPDDGDQEKVNGLLIELAQDLGLPLVATSNSFYLNADDHEGWEAMLCIQKGQTLEEYRRMSGVDINLQLADPEKIIEAFKHVPEAIVNTRKIADRCKVTIDLGNNYLPHFEVPGGKNDSDYLRELCEIGLGERYGERTEEINERFEFELTTINKMGFASYFLIVHDFVSYAKKKGILVGPGRGSAAGSIIAYVLQITDVDPIKYDLLFERFLNPDRISMPDIDLDFADSRRGEVLEYVRDKYGADHVAGIVTFGKMMPKAAVRDAARVLGLTFPEADRISKLMPNPVQGRYMPIADAVKNHIELRNDYQVDHMTKRVVDLAAKIEGAPRHTSQHACGIVISRKPLVEYVPIQASQHEDLDYVSMYSLGPVEAAGLVKMDFLGLSNLTIIEQALEIIEGVHGVIVDIEHLPLDDAKTYELLARGETTGVFQLESEGMRRYLIELVPTQFEDIMAMCALYRPGPLSAGMVPQYINRKHGREKVVYDHPLMEKILKETYGVTIYQEQIMRISRALAGFTGGEADTLRKAMGKKKRDVLEKMKALFVEGCRKNGVAIKTANKIWHDWEGFADYAFNKSHTACYGMIAYRTAYLKAHYPSEFMAAVMNSDAGNVDRMNIEVQECQRMGIKVLPPDVNESYKGFGVVGEDRKIRWGLVAIKNVGEDIAAVIVQERKEHGDYKDLSDFITRLHSRNFNRKSLEALIMAGALDRYGDRGVLLANLDRMLRFNKKVQQDRERSQGTLFDVAPDMEVNQLLLSPAPEVARSTRLEWERELLGIYVSEHPYTAYAEALKSYVVQLCDIEHKNDKDPVKVAGVVSVIREILTKKGDAMAFVRVANGESDIEIVVFPRTFAQHKEHIVEGRLVVVLGKVSEREGQSKSVIADSVACFAEDDVQGVVNMMHDGMWVAEDVHESVMKQRKESRPKEASVIIDLVQAPTEDQINGLRSLFQQKPGPVPVHFSVEAGGQKQRIQTEYSISPTNAIVDAIGVIVGKGNVRVVEPEKMG